MEKSIQFKGIALDRSDQLAQDGELSYCNGAEIKNGTLRPSVINKTSLGTAVGELLYVHAANGYCHYICRNDDSLVYYTGSESSLGTSYTTLSLPAISNLNTIESSAFTSLGNTLIINSPYQGIFYVLWCPNLGTAGGYKYLGMKPPMLDIRFRPGARLSEPDYEFESSLELVQFDSSFNVTASPDWIYTKQLPYAFYHISDEVASDLVMTTDESQISQDGEDDDIRFTPSSGKGPDLYLRSKYQAMFTEAMWAVINKTNSHIAENGRFYAPFFVRYAYRMYDGSTYMHSAPVLVAADLDEMAQVFLMNVISNAGDGVTDTTGKMWHIDGNECFRPIEGFIKNGSYHAAVRHKDGEVGYWLAYKPVDFKLEHYISSSGITSLKDWSDVIQSVDIFISAPHCWYKDTEKLTKFHWGGSVSQYIDVQGSSTKFISYDGFGTKYDGNGMITGKYLHCDIPRNYPSGKNKRFSETSAFFLLKSIKMDDLASTSAWSVLDVDSSIVKNISVQEQLKNDYNSHVHYIPTGQYNYNHRLHLFGTYKQLFSGFPAQNLLQSYTGSRSITSVAVKISTVTGDVWVRQSCSLSVDDILLKAVPMFYPDSKAIVMELYDNTSHKYLSFVMSEHPELNGSITQPWTFSESSTSLYTAPASLIVPVNDSLLVSEADNPFIFPAENVSMIGNGQILGLCSATRALSQGQFGSFPLMAFSTDGIWALNTSASGVYTAANPISREVCAYSSSSSGTITRHVAKCILQLDQSIVFVSDRGLNQLVGSDVVSISDVLKGQPLSADTLLQLLPTDTLSSLKTSYPALDLAKFPLRDLPIISGNMSMRPLYDCVNHRLLIFPSDYDSGDGNSSPCLVYNDSDRQYTSLFTDKVLAVLNSYPYPYLQCADKSIHRLDKQLVTTDTTSYSSVLITRHFSLGGYRDVISSIRHEKDFTTPPLMILFGSNDAVTDHYIGIFNRDHAEYLAGHPFRYFRLVMLLSMKQYERYSALVLGVTEKHSKL